MERSDDSDEQSQMVTLANFVIAMNDDPRPKEVGDRVVVWDGTFNADAADGSHRNGEEELFKKYSGIVIETRCAVIPYAAIAYLVGLAEMDDIRLDVDQLEIAGVCDLLVVFPDGTRVYVPSRLVRRID